MSEREESKFKADACMACLSEDITVYANDGWFGVECNECPAQESAVHRSAEDAVLRWNSYGRPRGHKRA
jgi:hypothetical protein